MCLYGHVVMNPLCLYSHVVMNPLWLGSWISYPGKDGRLLRPDLNTLMSIPIQLLRFSELPWHSTGSAYVVSSAAYNMS